MVKVCLRQGHKCCLTAVLISLMKFSLADDRVAMFPFFPQVLSERDIDPVRTTSNDICEIFSVSIKSKVFFHSCLN